MWIIAIAWMYVAVLMALAEAFNANGSVLGAIFTFLLYGVGPLALVLYLFGTPARRKALKRRELLAAAPASQAAADPVPPALASASDPDRGAHAAGDASITPVREEP